VKAEPNDIIAIEEEMAQAMLANDADRIGSYLTDDWAIVGGDGKLLDRSSFLNAVASGALTHDLMKFDDWRVRVYDGCAVATSEAWSGGAYQGRPFATHERSTSFYVIQDGEWRCAFTHLSELAEGED
jgi:ketosteroid isomerase-like protein